MAIQLNFPDKLDKRVTDWCIRKWSISDSLNAFGIVVAKWTPITMLVIICIGVSGYGLRHSSIGVWHGTISVVSAVSARALNEPLSRFIARPRPFEQYGFHPLLGHEKGQSFPSNHATGAFALAVGFYGVAGYFPILMTLAVFLALARLYSGVHHFTDVIAGCLHGSFIAMLILYAVTVLHLGSQAI